MSEFWFMDTRLRHIFEAAHQPLMMLPDTVEPYMAMLQQFVESKTPPQNPNRTKALEFAQFVSDSGTDYFGIAQNYDYYPVMMQDGILAIPVMGVILQKDYCYAPGTQTIANWYIQAMQDPNVNGILEIMDSPGGAVFGTEELARTKLKVREAGKEIITNVTGLAGSAGFYIASSSDKIFASSNNCIVGSIGAMIRMRDSRKYEELRGISTIEIYSEDSPEKNIGEREAMKGNTDVLAKGLLKDLDANFMAFVKLQRPQLTAKALKGDVFVGNAAVDNGLIDGVADTEFILQQFSTKKKMLEKIRSMFSAAATSVAEEHNETSLLNLQAKIDEVQAEARTLEAARSTLEAQLQAKEAKILSLESKVVELTAQVREQDQPATPPTTPAATVTEQLEPQGETKDTWAEYAKQSPIAKFFNEYQNA